MTGAGNFTITRNAQNGLPESVTGGAINLSRAFNGCGEVKNQNVTVEGQNIFSWNLTRNNNGRITQKIETIDGITSTYDYTYDPMGRLLTVTKNNALIEEYKYNPNGTGTRTYVMNSLRGISGDTYAYSDEDHLLIAGDCAYQYDADGFLTTKTKGTDVTEYSYSTRGELLSVILPDSRVIEYVHDPIGRRIAKKINGTIIEKYLWQGLTRLLAVYDGSDNLIMRFNYADTGMPISMTRSDGTYYLSYDQVGSLKIAANGSGNVTKRKEYDSFGNLINDTNPTFEVPFGFAGGLYDKDTGLIRFGYRDYDPAIGRWTAKDPILFNGGDPDLYGYVLNDPVNLIDPLGLWDMMSSYGALHSGYNPGRDAAAAHYNRNQFNQTVAPGIAKKQWDGSVPAYYHRQGPGNEGNQKFVSPDGHSEMIIDKYGQPLTLESDPVNGPTYNYQDPRSNPIGHFFDDMLFYYLLGNTPDDPSSIWERITGTYDGGPCK